MLNLNYRLLDADMYSYYPAPKLWLRWQQGYRWNASAPSFLGRYNGFICRIWKIGFGWHFGGGFYSRRISGWPIGFNWGKFHWVLFWYEAYDEWLENGGW